MSPIGSGVVRSVSVPYPFIEAWCSMAPSDDTTTVVTETVLLIPRHLGQTSYLHVLRPTCRAVPEHWHLEGRAGSRLHPVAGTESLAVPLTVSATELRKMAKQNIALQELLDTDGVCFKEQAYYWPEKLQRRFACPVFDATIHPERAPVDYQVPTRNEILSTSPPQKKQKQQQSNFTFAELFAGIGGFGVALEALGGKCVFASELEEKARRLYQENLKIDPENLWGDIYQVPDEALPIANTLTLLVGGFPCQPFSTLGEQPGIEDPKNGGLFRQIVRVILYSKPKGFLLENVPGLLEMTDHYETIMQELRMAGYSVVSEVVNARGLTVQSRKRLFFVGLRSASKGEKSPTFQFPFIPDLKLRAQHVVEYQVPLPTTPELNNTLDLHLTADQLQSLRNSGRWKPSDLVWPDNTLDTLIAHYGTSVARGGRCGSQLVACSCVVKDEQNDTEQVKQPEWPQHCNPRRLSPRECARVMGFPDEYWLHIRDDDKVMIRRKELYRMLGNAVCPPVIASLAGAVLSVCCDNTSDDWEERGRLVACHLAFRAARQGKNPT